ncbi:MAG TPA: FtsQ-type POTRA domain-containing protein [Bacillota bacterium]|nr:FtsQ-type POTRA domain-containing protein [Bacillota bacterium]
MEDKKIISIEDRIPKLKKQRKKKANRRLVFYLSLFFVLISIIIYLQSPLSYIKNIHVYGHHVLHENEIIELSDIKNDTNIWKVNLSEVEDAILKNPFIKDVQVQRKLPSTIAVEVEEYKIIGYLEKEDSYQPLLENGEEVDYENRYQQGDAPLLIHFDDEDILNSIAGQLQGIPDNILRLISEIHWEPEKENKYKVNLFMNDGYLVKGSIRNLAEKMEVYPSVVSQLEPEQKGIIHLNVGVYFEEYVKESE